MTARCRHPSSFGTDLTLVTPLPKM
jgi:hypothetical protein